MTPTMALAIHNALEREAATGRRAVVNARLVTITALAQRGWITAVSYTVREGSGELTQAGRDAYARHVARDSYPATAKQLGALRLVRSIAENADKVGTQQQVQAIHPRVFGVVRRRGWIAWDRDVHDYRLTEAGAAVLDEADEAGDAT